MIGLGTWLLLSCVKFCRVSRLWVVKPSTDHLTFDQLNLVKQLRVPPLVLKLDEKSGFGGNFGRYEQRSSCALRTLVWPIFVTKPCRPIARLPVWKKSRAHQSCHVSGSTLLLGGRHDLSWKRLRSKAVSSPQITPRG